MKLKQLFLLAVALIMLTMALASCELPFDLPFDIPFLGGGETTTAATTTDAATTTTGALITLPAVTAKPNPIVEVKKVNTASAGLRLSFNDKKTMTVEPSLSVGEGHNGVTYTHSFDKESGILTLRLFDSASKNIALSHLAELPASITVCLRENNKNLEWAYEGSDEWSVLCKVGATNAKLLADLCEATAFAKTEAPTEKGVYFTIKGDYLRFRAREWKSGTDLCMDGHLSGSSNKIFNISNLTEVNSTLTFTDTNSGDLWKSSGDDITPININGTYIGANHGYNLITAMKNPVISPKTEADIGSIWEVGGQQYVLVRVGDSPKEDKTKTATLWFCPISDAAMESGIFSTSKNDATGRAPTLNNILIGNGVTLTHVSGATNTDDFVVDRPIQPDNTPLGVCQFYIALNHVKMSAFLNGNVEVDLTKDGVYSAEFVDFYEEYDIIYLPDVLEYLIDNAGKNTNASHHDESLKESYVTVKNTYRYHKNGACVVYSSYAFQKDVEVGYIGGVQSIPFGDSNHYVYVPGANGYTTPTFQNGKNEGTFPNVNIGKNILVDPNYLTTTYFQLTTPDGAKAMNLGFNPLFGWGQNDVRAPHVGSGADALAFYYQNSYKMYPKLISGGTLDAGTTVDCIAYRLPSYKMDDDFFAINWYWVGDDIYLSLHTDHAVAEKTVTLPDYMNDMIPTVVEKSDSFTLVSDTIVGGIRVTTSGAGYTIVKLSPAN